MDVSLETMLLDKRIIILIGAGGVGKTTSSVALAFWAAKKGKKVALLSIDPARRLAAALGIPLGLHLQEIHWAHTDGHANQDPKGQSGRVFAGMLDQKAVFDQMVLKHAPSQEVAQKILQHPLYQSASTNLSGPIEYMALAKLKELADDKSYDVIIVDTPPDTHALDFLARPNVLSGFMDQGVLGWLIKPFLMASRFGLSRFLNTSERLMGGLSKVTGLSALTSFAEFLVLIQDIIEGFHQTGESIVSILHQRDTGFVLVLVPTHPAARSALNMHRQLKLLGYGVDLVVFNRTLPRDLCQQLRRLERGEGWHEQMNESESFPQGQREGEKVHQLKELRKWAQKAEDQSSVIETTLEHLNKTGQLKSNSEFPWIRIEEQRQNLGDLASTLALADLFGNELTQNQVKNEKV